MNILAVFVYCAFILLNHIVLLNAEVIAIDHNHDREIFMDSELTFTQPVWKNGIQGVVVEADPIDACVNISSPLHEFNSSLKWFVLISGGNCNYDTKVYYAQAAGFSAAIIYNRDARSIVKKSHVILPFPNISAVVISGMSALCITEKYLYTVDKRCQIVIYPNNSFNIMTFLLLFALVAGTFIMMMALFMIIKCIQQTRQRQSNRLSSRHLKQLLTLRYKKNDPYETCAICLEDYNERDRLRILPCSHGYHCRCIDPWLTNNKRTCPICKQKVVLTGVHSEGDTDSDTEGRAETAPLLRSSVINLQHGTFSTGIHNPGQLYQSHNRGVREGSGETTSRDVASDAFDETSEEEATPDSSNDAAPPRASTRILAVPCNSLNSDDGAASAASVNPFEKGTQIPETFNNHRSQNYNDFNSQSSKQLNHKRPPVV